MFAIPWHGHTLVGTTDTPIEQPNLEPVPMERRSSSMLSTARSIWRETNQERRPERLRGNPVRCCVPGKKNTAALLAIMPFKSILRLVNTAGGKWTTYRNMAEHCVDHAATLPA